MDVTEFMGNSNYLKAADLKGKTITVTVDEVDSADFTDDTGATKHKLVLKLKGKDKGIVMNVTNTKAMVSAFGQESDAWVGKDILLSVRETQMGPGIGVQAAPEDFDDDIPF